MGVFQLTAQLLQFGNQRFQFSDGSILKLPSALTAFQGQLIDLLKFPSPEVYLQPREAVR